MRNPSPTAPPLAFLVLQVLLLSAFLITSILYFVMKATYNERAFAIASVAGTLALSLGAIVLGLALYSRSRRKHQKINTLCISLVLLVGVFSIVLYDSIRLVSESAWGIRTGINLGETLGPWVVEHDGFLPESPEAFSASESFRITPGGSHELLHNETGKWNDLRGLEIAWGQPVDTNGLITGSEVQAVTAPPGSISPLNHAAEIASKLIGKRLRWSKEESTKTSPATTTAPTRAQDE